LALIAIVVAMMLSSFITNKRWDWGFAFQVMNQSPVLEGLWKGTIVGTVGAMIIGVGLGILIAIMRLSTNPVLKWVAFAYTWFFRAIPRYVLLAILGSGVGYLYATLHVGVPFGQQISHALGLSSDLTFLSLDINTLSNSIIAGIIGLGLSEAAYMAEIARAGILSVHKGQMEAGSSLGLHRGSVLRRIVIPQALRVILPPLTNQYLNLTKNSSLAVAIGYPDLVSVFAGTTLSQTGQAIEIIGITMGVYLLISLVTSAIMSFYGWRIGRSMGG